ncbi:MAG TPA: FAD:protein FMN transferase [Intrasporangium sp.]|nr:FAD:protein FMN transferase [Intrasporangium sp.]
MSSPAASEPLLGRVSFRAISTTNTILTTDPRAAGPAAHIARDYLAELDRAVSRFRPDSEVSLLAARAATGPASAFVSPVFADHLDIALRMARITGGLVDPTVGSAVVASGYDDDIDAIRRRRFPTADTRRAGVPGWRAVHFSPATRRVTVPRGTLLDLGATAKAYAADVLAARLLAQLPGGFLVDLGGDIAVAGPTPAGGWQIGIEDAAGGVLQVVASTGTAVATSSTRLRRWSSTTGERHHIVDPRTGLTAPAAWAQVSCAAATAAEANAAATAAVVLGPGAPAWLEEQGVAARLDGPDGDVVTTPGWPVADLAQRSAS